MLDIGQHLPVRPVWCCRLDARPWPCPDARLALLDSFRNHLPGLTLYLAARYVEALDDLHTIDPEIGPPPDPRALYERVIGWVPVRRGR